MYLIDQDIANDIAKGPMKYWFTKILLEASEEEAEKTEDLIWKEVEPKYSQGSLDFVATAVRV